MGNLAQEFDESQAILPILQNITTYIDWLTVSDLLLLTYQQLKILHNILGIDLDTRYLCRDERKTIKWS